MKSVNIQGLVWMGKDKQIRIATKDFISTVSNDPKSVRYHPHLFRHLTGVLEAIAGKSATGKERAIDNKRTIVE